MNELIQTADGTEDKVKHKVVIQTADGIIKIDQRLKNKIEEAMRNITGFPKIDSINLLKEVPLIYNVKSDKRTFEELGYSASPKLYNYNRKVKVDIPTLIKLEEIASATKASKITRIDFKGVFQEVYVEQSSSLLDIYEIIMKDYTGLSFETLLEFHFVGFGLKDADTFKIRKFADKYNGRDRIYKCI